MNIKNRVTYKFFKREFEELLRAGFSREQAFFVLKRIHQALDHWQGYHSASLSKTAGDSLKFLIQNTQDEAREELKEHILDNAITYGLSPEDEYCRAKFKELEMSTNA